MDKFDKIKSDLTNQLKQFEKQLVSLEGQFEQSKEEAVEKLEILKQVLYEKTEKTKARLNKLVDINEVDRLDLKSKIEILQTQLKLGKAEALESLKEQKDRIRIATDNLKVEIDKKIKGLGIDILEAFDDLDAEFESIEIKFSQGKDWLDKTYFNEKEDLKESFTELKEGIFELRKETNEKTKDALSLLKDKFSRLKDSINGDD